MLAKKDHWPSHFSETFKVYVKIYLRCKTQTFTSEVKVKKIYLSWKWSRPSFNMQNKYGGDPNSDHLKTGIIQRPDILVFGFEMRGTIPKLDKVQFSSAKKSKNQGAMLRRWKRRKSLENRRFYLKSFCFKIWPFSRLNIPPRCFSRFLNGKPFETGPSGFWTIWIPDMSSIRIPTILKHAGRLKILIKIWHHSKNAKYCTSF